jgi:branched-chain amino acid transport system ATP-binding protein
MLEVKNIDIYRGETQVLWDVSITVNKKEIVAVLGANGAGKSTLIRGILGLLHPFSGKIIFKENDISQLPSFAITRMGVACIPEGRNIFNDMTVLENLELGAYSKRARPYLNKTMNWILEIFPVLYERKNQLGGTLSGGEQQMLAIGRALMSKPDLLLLDELSLGLAPIIIIELFKTIDKLREEESTLLLVEQNVETALKHCDRGYILETGRISMEGDAKELIANDHIRKAYLGI